MSFKNISDLTITITTTEHYDLSNIDTLTVDIFDRTEKYDAQGNERMLTPIATLDMVRILGNGSHANIVDSADSISGDLYFAANSVFKHEDSQDSLDYLTKMFKMKDYPMELADTMFYIEEVKLNSKISQEKLSIILSAAMQKVSKGLQIDSWVAIAYSEQTLKINDNEEKVDIEDKNGMLNVLKGSGFRKIPKEFSDVKDNQLLAVSSHILNLEFEPKKINKHTIK